MFRCAYCGCTGAHQRAKQITNKKHKAMRTKVELLSILKANINERLRSGLCRLAYDLYLEGIYSYQECYLIRDIISQNVPSLKDYYKYDGYYFEIDNKVDRHIYLNNLIEKFS